MDASQPGDGAAGNWNMETDNAEKKVYSHPEIYFLGSVKNLTQAKSGWNHDNKGPSPRNNPKDPEPFDGLDLLGE